MWLITNDWCGMACAFATYLIVASVYVGFIRIGIWDWIQEGDPRAIFHFTFFQFSCVMIFWSHWKCMTTQPGILPIKIDTLDFEKLPA